MSTSRSIQSAFVAPECYERVTSAISMIIEGRRGGGKTRLIDEVHTSVSTSSFSIRVSMDARAFAKDNLLDHVWRCVLAAFWARLKEEPTFLNAIADEAFLIGKTGRLVKTHFDLQNDDWIEPLQRLAFENKSCDSVIAQIIEKSRNESNLSVFTVVKLAEQIQDCAKVLYMGLGEARPISYLWFDVADEFDCDAASDFLRELIVDTQDVIRGSCGTVVKFVASPKMIRQFHSKGFTYWSDPITLSWDRLQLLKMADDIVMQNLDLTFAEIISMEWLYSVLQRLPRFIDDSPSAWIGLANLAIEHWRKQSDKRPLSESAAQNTLMDYARHFRQLRFEPDCVYAGHERLDMQPRQQDILKTLFNWQNAPMPRYLHPSAQQIADNIYKNRPPTSGSGKRVSSNSVLNAMSRMRKFNDKNPSQTPLECLHALWRTKKDSVDKRWLIYLKDESGFKLENVQK